ncbi:tripartite motif-containing protein 35-like [Syngnathus acus]|uniref:tripartite motif-containing protein 35-like n=1 Tax=Syngnathus acus TaxID=161584 RepID=UPI0018861675|nr:tripartite motif-containing protein 35-like [Syngnathus acus]
MTNRVEDNLQCPSCSDIYEDPVMLPCSHSFCRACVQQWWEQKEERTCPLCRKRCNSMDLRPNLCESEYICSLHKEKLKLFCLDHQELVCPICRDAEIHTGHEFSLLEEIVTGNKEKVQESLQDAKKRLEEYNEIMDECNEQGAYIKVQRQQVERRIKKDFEELCHLLQVEEEARLSAVREEEQEKSCTMKKKIEALSTERAALSDAIRSTEEQVTSDPVSFIKNFQTAMTRIQKLPEKPELLPGALLDKAKHVGNLKFAVWERMKEMVFYSPVILDPNTAGPRLTLSEDLTSVSCQEGQQRPNNPERLTWYCVLGSVLGFGTHTWDVEVGHNRDWRVGVMWGDPCVPYRKECSIELLDGTYRKFGDQSESFFPSVKPQRIRVQLNMNERSVSFSESSKNTQLWKSYPSDWPCLSDNINIFPFFRTVDKIPLQIIPLGPRVTTQ